MKPFILLSLLISVFSYADLDSMRARAPEIAQMKEKGQVGEQIDGYLGAIVNDASVKAVVDAENADRRSEYSKRATAQGQSVDVFAKIIGEAKTRQESSGRMVRGASGSWSKK